MDRNRYAEPGHIAQRENRCSGSAEASYTYLFPKEGYELTVKRPMAPPIFAANETVTLQGPKGRIEGVRILGPLRNYNQVEILRADNFVLGSRAEVL